MVEFLDALITLFSLIEKFPLELYGNGW